MTELNTQNNINLADNISKNVKFNEIQLTNDVGQKTQLNFTQEQLNLAKQMSNYVNQHNQTQQIQQKIKEPIQNAQNIVTPQNDIAKLTPGIQLSDYYSLFGFQLSKTTVYIFIGFIIILTAYLIYTKMYSKINNKKKRQKEVSYDDQEKLDSE